MSSLKKIVEKHGTTLGELIIDEIVEMESGDTVKIPKSLSVRFTRTGKIVFKDVDLKPSVPRLEIEGSFEAGLYPIFQFEQNSQNMYPVLFKRRAVKEVLTCWFGAVPDSKDKLDSHLAIQRGGKLYMQLKR